MEYHNKISFFKNPGVWIKNKYYTGLNQKEAYITAIIPGIIMIMGGIADTQTIFGYDHNFNENITIVTLVWFLFIFGTLNLVFVLIIQRTGLRLGRERINYRTMHKCVVERMREYRAERRNKLSQGQIMPKEDIERNIRELLESFNDNYMKPFYRQEVSVTVKYLINKELYPIRVGGDIAKRSFASEKIDISHVYKALSESGRKLRYIYVKNLDKPDFLELEVLGKYKNEIQNTLQL